ARRGGRRSCPPPHPDLRPRRPRPPRRVRRQRSLPARRALARLRAVPRVLPRRRRRRARRQPSDRLDRARRAAVAVRRRPVLRPRRDAAARRSRARTERGVFMTTRPADALVFFGATGDLAYKKIFPALHGRAQRGRPTMPVIGVAKSGWTIDQLRARAEESVRRHGGLDRNAFATLMQSLGYVDGDYGDAGTFERLASLLGLAQTPVHYLAI